MRLIVGLGNPEKQYEKTRHNLGFMVIEQFLKNCKTLDETFWKFEKKFKSDLAFLEWQPKMGKLEKVILAKPQTHMNNSGQAVKLLSIYYKLQTADVWVVHDDIDIPLGNMKIRFGCTSAGHNGIESIIKSLGTEKFWRFRMGIGRDAGFKIQNSEAKKTKLKDVEDFVLRRFSEGEIGKLKDTIKHGAKSIETGLEKGLNVAMNRFNVK